MEITSKTLVPIEEHFKVEAGPGAGKTDFLVNHLKNVVQHSTRLSCTRKAACITYTNTGVSTILQRLGENISEKVEVSTIHSFLYKNIVKPYASFIPASYELDATCLSGHDDFTIRRSILNKWLDAPVFDSLKPPNTKNQLLFLPEQTNALLNWLSSMQCVYQDNHFSFTCDSSKSHYQIDSSSSSIKKSNLQILSNHLIDLRKIFWREGKLFHDDVLFFSAILIDQYPFLLDVLRAKFPYLFLDEYQDTSPIQAYIINKIKESETIVGVIGDKAQSIYSFQGASPSLFDEFNVSQESKFTITENHRSSDEIVQFLNILRTDIHQKSCRSKNGNSICIFVGNRAAAYKAAQRFCETSVIESLARDNITSNALKKDISNSTTYADILQTFRRVDSNSNRRRYVLAMISSIELAKSGNIKHAIKSLEETFRTDHSHPQLALNSLSNLLASYSTYSSGNLLYFYEQILPFSRLKLPTILSGNVKAFYESTDYQSLAIHVNIPEDTSEHITIHKSKGSEFKNVFVVGNKNIREFLLDPHLENEEHRIAYVAFSRAVDRLFIQFESDAFSYTDEESIKSKFSMVQIIRL